MKLVRDGKKWVYYAEALSPGYVATVRVHVAEHDELHHMKMVGRTRCLGLVLWAGVMLPLPEGLKGVTVMLNVRLNGTVELGLVAKNQAGETLVRRHQVSYDVVGDLMQWQVEISTFGCRRAQIELDIQ